MRMIGKRRGDRDASIIADPVAIHGEPRDRDAWLASLVFTQVEEPIHRLTEIMMQHA